MIEVKNLTKRYGDHLAVDNSSFTVQDGEIVGFLGPNGAGKTTTMNMLTGYLSSTEGELLIDGIDILEDPVHAKMKIGYLPEVPPLYPEMTVQEYLQFALALKRVPAKNRKEQVEKLLKQTRIKDMQNRLITNLSKGYKQRVGLAAALAGDPDVLHRQEELGASQHHKGSQGKRDHLLRVGDGEGVAEGEGVKVAVTPCASEGAPASGAHPAIPGRSSSASTIAQTFFMDFSLLLIPLPAKGCYNNHPTAKSIDDSIDFAVK